MKQKIIPKPLTLIWTRYENKGISNYLLLVVIGLENEYLHSLIADKIPDIETTIIRTSVSTFTYTDFQSVHKWIKTNLPISYKNAYFCKPINRFSIEQEYPIGKL